MRNSKVSSKVYSQSEKCFSHLSQIKHYKQGNFNANVYF